MSKATRPEDHALRRMEIISPLLAEGLDEGLKAQLRHQLCQKYNLSARTLRRYLAEYRLHGYEGLLRRPAATAAFTRLDPEIVEQAIILRREVPNRSVLQIIRILEMEERVEKGMLKRSTLQRAIAEKGFSSARMRLYTGKGLAARRFQKPHRCQLWQSDIKYGPYLPIGQNGKPHQVYLVAVIDDATRFIVHARFYSDQRLPILEDSLRQAVSRWGRPDALYVDNGKQFRSDWLQGACNRLGIKLKFTRAYRPESKGKVERFNRTVDEFLTEAALQRPESLNRLNELLQVWIEECYHKRPHNSLKGKTPETAFRTDTRPLQYVDPRLLQDAFCYTKSAKVDKIGCLKFKGSTYEVGHAFIGRTVEIRYMPESLEEIEVRCRDLSPVTARKLVISASCGPRETLPKVGSLPAKSSRLLDSAEKKHKSRTAAKATAISFTQLRMGGLDDVP